MDRYVAFLRGMNLGKRRIKNPELAAEFEQLGFADVATFRASGNVIFSVEKKASEAALAKRIEAGLEQGLGYDVPVYLRGLAEVAKIAARNPFDAKAVAASKGKLQVSMLPRKPAAKAKKTVLGLATDQDQLAISSRELYWLPSGGTLETELDLKAIERALGPGTMRTKGTVDQIAAKYCG
jgi:uncharacterized protein (DUF1697 family)